MSIEQRDDGPRRAAARAEAGGRPYRKPQIEEWGSLADLTQGAKSGFEDFPGSGGTQGV